MIQKISMLHFRGHSKSMEFGPNLNSLRGPNESGKSTIKEALSFLWSGTDSSGLKSPDHLISKGQDAMEIMIQTEHAKVSRRKRRDQTSVIKVERNGYPSVQMNQTEFGAILKLSHDAFMSCWNVGYFMSMTQQAQLAVLGELAAVDRRELFKSMLPAHIEIPAKIKLINPKIDADAIATERRQKQNTKASDEGVLKQVRSSFGEISAANAEIDVDSFTKALNEINAKLEAHDFYKKALSKYQVEKLKWNQSAIRKDACEVGLKALKLYEPAIFDGIRQHLEKNRVKHNDIAVLINTLKKKMQAMPAAPKKPDLQTSGTCDKCGQPIDETHVARITADYEKDLITHNKEAREVQTYNDRINLAIDKGHAAMHDIDVESQQLSNTLDHDERANRDILKRKGELERELAEIAGLKEPEAPSKPDGDEETLRKEQLEINTALNLERQRSTQLEKLKHQEGMLVRAIEILDKQIMDYSAIEYSLKNLPQMETMKILETLTVDGLSITLNEGNLSIMADGIPYQSLSSGRKMKADLAFCGSLRRAAGPKAPSWIFCDNADLMDHWRNLLPQGVQVFAAKVDPDLKELVVLHE